MISIFYFNVAMYYMHYINIYLKGTYYVHIHMTARKVPIERQRKTNFYILIKSLQLFYRSKISYIILK